MFIRKVYFMSSKTYIFSSAKRNKTLHVTANQMLLLKMIGSLGFVTSKQLDLLWSVIQQYPTTFSHTILSKWTVYDGLLNFVPISANLNINRSKRNTTAASHNCYVLSNSCSKWLAQLNILPISWDNTSINSHNEQAVETIVQSLYTARFGSSMLNSVHSFYSFKDGQYSYCSQAINGCIKKGVIKGAKEKGEQGAKHRVELTLVPTEKVKQLPSNATATLNTIIEHLSPKTFNDVSSLLPSLSYIVDTLHTDGISLTPLTKLFNHQINIDNVPIYKLSGSNGSLRPNTSSIINQKNSFNNGQTFYPKNNSISTSFLHFSHFIYYSPLLATLSLIFANSFTNSLFTPLFRELPVNLNENRAWDMLGIFWGLKKDTLRRNLGDILINTRKANKGLYTKLYEDANNKLQQPLSPLRGMLKGLFGEINSTLLGEAWEKLGKFYKASTNYNNFGQVLFGKRLSWCSFSLKCLKYIELYLSFFFKKDILGRQNIGFNVKHVSSIKESKKNAYVAMAAKPRRYKNKMVKIDGKKFNNLSKNTNYSSNLLNQQDQLLDLLDDDQTSKPHKNVQNKKAAFKIKNETASKNRQNICRTKKILSYYFPNKDYLIQVFSTVNLPHKISNFNQLSLEQQLLLINIAENNLHIYKYFVEHHQIADYIAINHLDLPFKTKFVRSQNNINRDKDLISNPYLDLCNYDFRSFNQQFGFKNFAESKDLPFVADMMISFYRKRRRHEIFLELDNRTEANNTQVQKIMNYIWYALENPDKDVDMVIAITDGSLKSKRVPEYTNLGRKLGNLATQFLKTYLNTSNNNKAYLATLYRQATNLHIYLSGVSEAHIDIARILLGSNDVIDKLLTIEELVKNLSLHSRWSVKYIPSDGIKELQNHPDLLFSTGNDSIHQIVNSNAKGIFRYLSANVTDTTLGMLKFTDKLTGSHQYQQIINANEHDLDTIITMYNQISSHTNNSKQFTETSISIYQHCLEVNTAIILPSYTKKFHYTSTYSPVLPYLIQPRYDDNLPSHKLIRWILVQYTREVSNYYLFGAINKAALKRGTYYSTDHINSLLQVGHPRSYETLQQLANELSPEEFINQLRIDEVPLDLLKALTARWPSEAYYVPRFISLPFVKTPKDVSFFEIKDKYEFKDFIHGLNSTLPDKRTTNIL